MTNRSSRAPASDTDDGESFHSDDSLRDDRKHGKRQDDYGSSDAETASSGSSDEESGGQPRRQSRTASRLLPVILILAIAAATALAYCFYSRSQLLSASGVQASSAPESDTQISVSADAESITAAATASDDSSGAEGATGANDAQFSSSSGSSRSASGASAQSTGPNRSGTTGGKVACIPFVARQGMGAHALMLPPNLQSPPTTPTATGKPAAIQAQATQEASNPTKASNGGKKGAGYNKAEYTQQLGLAWAYNWASSPGGTLGNGVMYVPQLWGAKGVGTWEKEAKAAIDAGATHILGFNEPDLGEQANLTPSQAADLWKAQVQKFSGSAKLVSPGVTNGLKTDDGKDMGVPWLLDFVAACDGCTIDAFALHWYDKASNTDYFTSYLTDAYSKLKKPIWLTEFMGTGTPAEQKKFLEFAVPWLEKQAFIERYAAFGAFADNPLANFLNKDGSLNDLGKAYASL
ncbi:hypothetical protein JCM10908_003779 [Rhodotorula pacifica]|uniref:glycoside hydrolase family protein n=1 Tax=Rhodotorula pacifica TaxID=1495444 RepID=UPI00316FC790